jgi:predicted lipoprotein with Yx(FWY)xxD motif
VKVGDTALGKVLTDVGGFTLYTFKKDVAGNGKSAAEALAAVWPPLSLDAAPSNVAGATGAWAVFTRADGKKQVTYNGSPLYTYANDQAPGDTNGDKVGGVWFASITPQASVNAPAAPSRSTTQAEAPAADAPPSVAPPPIAAPSVMPPPTVAPQATKAAPTPMPTLAPYKPPSEGNGYGY